MRSSTQALLLAVLGAVLVRLAVTDEYLRYVTPWMRWPLILSGVLLLALAIGPILRVGRSGAEEHEHDHPVPRLTWLLILPAVVTFTVAPPALDSYLAERRADESVAVPEPAAVVELPEGRAVQVPVNEFIWRAQEGGASMADQPVTLVGFVSYGRDGVWYLTRMAIGCCAADAVAYRVEVRDADPPPRDQWLRVTGVHVPGTGSDREGGDAAVIAADVEQVDEPRQPYA